MNFSEMTGYEFEDFISGVLSQYGFSVSKTAYSHDGGIDLLAIFEKPLFAGKYIIQCKNWVGAVGQPEVRDLYGVVMSERANKGILITPSDFTEQAYEFAKDKNIELINGKLLQTILDRVSLSEGHKPNINKSQNFNYDQYRYLNDKIENEPTEPQNYLNLILFLRNYILNGDVKSILIEEIFDKTIDLNERLMKRCYKRKSEKYYRLACLYRIAEIEIIRGNLGKATSILLDNDWFYIDKWHPHFTFKYDNLTREAEMIRIYHRMLARNLYISYKAIGCEFGCQEQLRKPISKIYIPFRPTAYVVTVDGNECLEMREYILNEEVKSLALYEQFKNGDVTDTFYFELPNPGKDALSYDVCSPQTASVSQFQRDFYVKSNDEILIEITEAFKQHGIGD